MTEEKIPGAGLLVWRHNKLLTYTYRYRSTLSDSDGDVRISPSRTKTKGNHHHWHSGHYVTNLSMLHRTLLRTFRSDSTGKVVDGDVADGRWPGCRGVSVR